jgi:hypothetical protein
MDVNENIKLIIHEVNVAQSIACNRQAMYHISKKCHEINNYNVKKWNELKIWMKDNPSATLENIQYAMSLLENDKAVRDFKILTFKKTNIGFIHDGGK